MPRIFDNLTPETRLLSALQQTLEAATRADFCVGYFNLRGWRGLAPFVDKLAEGARPCRVLIGMQATPHHELRESLSLRKNPVGIDNQTAHRLRVKLADQLRQQLTIGAPTNADEQTLRQLSAQLRSGKVVVKLFLRHRLHAKLYLLHRDDSISPVVGYLGSSNLTFAGLSGQGELNVDVVEQDAALKLQGWFEDRWSDRLCVEITKELIQIIEESWARERLIPPYHLYLKMAYHLSQEARAGLAEFKVPKVFRTKLFDFQAAAVRIAAHHLNKRGGVLIGDVVGLGKTLMATALARIFEDDQGLETLIICPKNLAAMWEDYAHQYRLRAKVLPLSRVQNELPRIRRYRIVVIDESHNLRNREGKRYRAIREYVLENESRCILLTATPYNKTYQDLSNQLRVFLEDDQDLGIRPERMLRELGEIEFIRRHQAGLRTLAAFEKSEHADDWRDLMRLYLVRRTRSFIQNNYAELDPETGRKFLTFEDGSKSFFPVRTPRTVRFANDDSDPHDQYARLYSAKVVRIIRSLRLPRYGLGNYLLDDPVSPPTNEEVTQIKDLSRAGKRLIGFCRTNLFKRLESSGVAFLQSIYWHVLRNYVFMHAIRNGLPLPLGTQNAELLDSRFTDHDADQLHGFLFDSESDDTGENAQGAIGEADRTRFDARAAEVYADYRQRFRTRFKWLRPHLFDASLEADLQTDSDALEEILNQYGAWEPVRDAKLNALHGLLTGTYPERKVLVFSQFADTVRYLEEQLRHRGLTAVAGVTGDSPDPTLLATRFSPNSNPGPRRDESQQELRVLIATDLLSEGQNLQDCNIVVNYDLPWAIIRLIQRVGRVDRIGQQAEEILCHSFLPADGVEKIINLRGRMRERLRENAEVVGTDEAFFEDDNDNDVIADLYHERAGILDAESDGEVDLASQAFQIWKNAIGANPKIEKAVTSLPDVALSSRNHRAIGQRPEGVLVFMRTADGNDALAYVDREGRSITESQLEVLAAAECSPDTPAQPHHESHHELVRSGVEHLIREEKRIGGQLGRPSGARYRSYTRLKQYAEAIRGQVFDTDVLRKAINAIYRYPLRQSAVDTLNRQMRGGASDEQLAEIVVSLHEEDRLCLTAEDGEPSHDPQIICSLGLFEHNNSPL